jgi:formiminotetrahydrofolate cyclodeaminase
MAGSVIAQGNPNTVTDAAVATMMASTAVLGALYNVKINLSAIRDSAYVDTMRQQVDAMEAQVVKLETQILSKIDL